MTTTDFPSLDQLAAREAANNTRSALIQGLRDLADALEQHPGIPEPAPVGVNIFLNDNATLQMAAIRRAIGGTWEKQATDQFFWIRKRFGPVSLEVNAYRDQVCTRVVVGTETVEVPDPAAPKVTVEREIVRWDCSPLLDDEQASA
jgi:hypothetical protein